jgi:hypothetical protein
MLNHKPDLNKPNETIKLSTPWGNKLVIERFNLKIIKTTTYTKQVYIQTRNYDTLGKTVGAFKLMIKAALKQNYHVET